VNLVDARVSWKYHWLRLVYPRPSSTILDYPRLSGINILLIICKVLFVSQSKGIYGGVASAYAAKILASRVRSDTSCDLAREKSPANVIRGSREECTYKVARPQPSAHFSKRARTRTRPRMHGRVYLATLSLKRYVHSANSDWLDRAPGNAPLRPPPQYAPRPLIMKIAASLLLR
jgi:hypothetical protein